MSKVSAKVVSVLSKKISSLKKQMTGSTPDRKKEIKDKLSRLIKKLKNDKKNIEKDGLIWDE